MSESTNTVHELCEWIGYLITLVDEMTQRLDTLEQQRLPQQPNNQQENVLKTEEILKSALGNSASPAILVAENIARQQMGQSLISPDHGTEMQFYGESTSFIDETERELQMAREMAFLDSAVKYPFE